MAVALWTAFSLNIPEREPEPERSLLEPPEEEGEETGQSDQGAKNDEYADEEKGSRRPN
jgi:hypothetical protein